MTFDIFLNFNDGLARNAAEFYANVFRSKVKDLMTYGTAANNPGFQIKDSEKDYLMYASVKIGDKNVMFMDMSADWRVVMGGNITPCVVLSDHAEIDRITNELAANGGTIITAPQKMFFSEYYAMVTDKFGITWHIYVGE